MKEFTSAVHRFKKNKIKQKTKPLDLSNNVLVLQPMGICIFNFSSDFVNYLV